MKLRMVSIDSDGTVRVAADGPVIAGDFQTPDHNLFADLLGEGWAKHRILLDLQKVDEIDSCAVGWMLNSQSEMSRAGGRLVPHSPQPRVFRLLQALKIISILSVAETESSARSAFKDAA
jgi:anti-anti-sigma factor